jgi:glycosyltransferase involved in cell wall biosynthesis
MHVGLNLVFLVPGETGGMEVVARELIPALREAAPGLRITAFVNREAAQAGDGPWGELVPAITVPVRARNRAEWVRGEQALLPRLASREGVDLVHSLASTAPTWGRFRRVVTIHDLIHRIYPDAHAGALALGMRGLVALAARRSHRIVSDSASTRDDLVRLLHVAPAKIDVVPLGVGASPPAGPPGATPGALRAAHRLGDRRVVLSVSAKRPHKNLLALLEALALMPSPERPVLVVPGYPTWHEAELRSRAEALGLVADVRWLGWVSAEDLEGLYGVADVFVFPSLYEGFGLPVLEAMRRGVPVACSDRSSLPEVAGDAALLFDPGSPRAIADAMTALLGDRALADRFREAGRARAAAFTWRRTAEGVVASYRRALAS